MGTAGPLALARDILYNDTNTPFFVLNRWAGAWQLRWLGGFHVCNVTQHALLFAQAAPSFN